MPRRSLERMWLRQPPEIVSSWGLQLAEGELCPFSGRYIFAGMSDQSLEGAEVLSVTP